MKIDWKNIVEGWLFLAPLLVIVAAVISWGIWSDSQRIEALKEISAKCERAKVRS